MKAFIVALRATLVTLVITGLAYPLAITGLAQVLFPSRANGSIVTDDKGKEVGSELIGQGFADPGYLHSRPSATGYDAANSGGTNLGATSKKLRDGATDVAAAYRRDNALAADIAIPVDAVGTSMSGIDPHISPENARLQIARIATARGVTPDRVQAVIDDYTEGRDVGFLGEPRVNVLMANLALDRKFGRPAHVAADGATLHP